MESAKYTIQEAIQVIQELGFGEETCNINQYISPAVYYMLQNSLPTSALVEKSFSMLKKLLAKDRNFKVENVRHYMILHFNAST